MYNNILLIANKWTEEKHTIPLLYLLLNTYTRIYWNSYQLRSPKGSLFLPLSKQAMPGWRKQPISNLEVNLFFHSTCDYALSPLLIIFLCLSTWISRTLSLTKFVWMMISFVTDDKFGIREGYTILYQMRLCWDQLRCLSCKCCCCCRCRRRCSRSCKWRRRQAESIKNVYANFLSRIFH